MKINFGLNIQQQKIISEMIIKPFSSKNEEIMSLAAGRYLSSDEQKMNYSLLNFKSFKKYANRNLTYYFESIQDISTENPYYYNSGIGLALLLDQIQPQWKKSAFQEKGFLFTQVKNWCGK